MLTTLQARSLPPGRYHDGTGTGLILEVRASGGRFWLQRLRFNGRVCELGHGAFPDVSVTQARVAAQATKTQAAAGIDPLAARRASQAEAAEAAQAAPIPAPRVRTLSDAVDGHIAAREAGWSEKLRKAFKTRLEHHAGALMTKEVGTITLEDVRAALAPIWTTKPVMAQKVRGHLEHALEYSIAAGWRTGTNPALWRGGLRALLARPSTVHTERNNPSLDWHRVPAFLAELVRMDGSAARALRFTILTAARSGEVRGMTWGEVDFIGKVWRVPASRMKAREEHRVPLTDAALAVLAEVKPEQPEAAALIFPGATADRALSDMSLLKCILTLDKRDAVQGGWRDENGIRVTCHGFRASFRTWGGDTAQPRELVEASLAHAVGNKVERAYHRSDLLARRRPLMEAWAAHCVPARRNGRKAGA